MTTDTAALATDLQNQASNPTQSVWVSASAGSGKTKVLTDRVLRLLLAGVGPDRILALTFTKAAAAEMSNRINDKLAGWAVQNSDALDRELIALTGESSGGLREAARRLFARVLDLPSGMRIQTIHAFCQSLLGRFPIEAGVAANFQVMDEREARELLDAARDAVLIRGQRRSAEASANITRWIKTVSWHTSEDDFTKLLGQLLSQRGALSELFAKTGGAQGYRQQLAKLLAVPPGKTEAQLTLEFVQHSGFDDKDLKALAFVTAEGGENDTKLSKKIVSWLALGEPERVQQIDTYLDIFLTTGLTARKPGAVSVGSEKTRPGSKQQFTAWAEQALEFLKTRNALRLVEDNSALFALAEQIIAEYARRKAANTKLDFDDLVEKTRALLKQPGGSEWVAYKLDSAISHILVDESQDTNAPQWRIIEELANEHFSGQGQELNSQESVARSLFVVGDRKQSIYSFQGADPERFDAMRDHFEGRAFAAAMPWQRVPLSVSFRSTSAVLNAVDATFAPAGLKQGELKQALEGNTDWSPHQAHRSSVAGSVTLAPIVDQKELELANGAEAQALLAEQVADDIAQWTDPAAAPTRLNTITEKGQPRRARPGDVMILLKNRRPLAERLVSALQDRGVPVAGLDRIKLSDQLLFKDLLALTRFVLFPDDDLSLAEVLRGPFCRLSEDSLFKLSIERPSALRLWSRLRDHPEGTDEISKAKQFLLTARRIADYAPAFEFFTQVLTELGGRSRLFAQLGGTIEDAINEFLALVLDFERDQPPSLQNFERWVRDADLEIKRDTEESGFDQVRIMTVHGSKGLQAPIVLLPDTIHQPSTKQRLYWQDGSCIWLPNVGMGVDETDRRKEITAGKARQESARLAYVAMTRAEDHLHIYGVKTAKAKLDDSWYSWMQQGLQQAGAQEFAGGKLRLESAEFIAPSTGIAMSDSAGANEVPKWLHKAPGAEPTPPRPLTPSIEAEEDNEPVLPPRATGQSAEGLKGRFERGRLTHHLLQHLPATAPAERRTLAVAYLAQTAPNATAAEHSEILNEVFAIVEDSVFAPLFGPGSRAEVPITGLLGTRVISGRVDRLLVTDNEVWIVDYKSNRPPPRDSANLPRLYVVQMAAYAQVLAKVYPNHSVRAFILWSDGAHLMELPSTQLLEQLS